MILGLKSIELQKKLQKKSFKNLRRYSKPVWRIS
jgi:hypothetical protein